jgi:hypothetical protein
MKSSNKYIWNNKKIPFDLLDNNRNAIGSKNIFGPYDLFS